MIRALVLALLLVGCRQALGIPGGFDTPGCEEGGECFSVAGRVIGIDHTSEPVAINLGDLESLAPDHDGEFAFTYGIKDRAPYLVTASPNCVVGNEQGLIDGAGVDNVEVYCDGLVSLNPLTFSAPLELDQAFRPSIMQYTARGSLLTQQLALIAPPTYPTATIGVSVGGSELAGAGGVYGPVPASSSSFVIEVAEPSWGMHTYEVALDRSEPTLEFGYGKAPASAASEQFGAALAAAGDVLVVGAPLTTDGGRVTVFRRTNRSWTMERELRAPLPAADDRFGASVAIDGATLVIGAPGIGTATGAAYTSTFAGGAWSDASKLTVPASTAGDRLGAAVAIAGSVVVVGAPGASNAAGKAFVLGGTPVTLVAPNAGAGDRFGASVAASAQHIVVGAPGEDSLRPGVQTATPFEHDELYGDAGAAYAFTLDGTVTAFLKALITSAGDEFGSAVAVRDDLVVVGAPLADLAGPAAGAAYVFRASPWSETVQLVTSSPDAAGDNFGRAIALAGNVLAIGSPYEDSTDEQITDVGAVHVFAMTASGSPDGEPRMLRASNADSGDCFGSGLALTLDALAVGAPFEDSAGDSWNGNHGNGAGDAGAIYTFR